MSKGRRSSRRSGRSSLSLGRSFGHVIASDPDFEREGIGREALDGELFSERFLTQRALLQAIDPAQPVPPVLLSGHHGDIGMAAGTAGHSTDTVKWAADNLELWTDNLSAVGCIGVVMLLSQPAHWLFFVFFGIGFFKSR